MSWRDGLSEKPVRILHTADWHAGRNLMGRDRSAEIRDALNELAEVAGDRAVDLVLVAGDIFDSRNPPAEAEAAVYSFFARLKEQGIPSAVIAGNHDSPRRLDAVAGLLRESGAHVVGEVRTRRQGGLLRFGVQGTEVQVAALPFASERRLLNAEQQLELTDAERKPHFRQLMGDLILNLSQEFSNGSVNVLMMHGTMEGARLSKSEYEFHSSEHYVLGSSLIPGSVQYLALGHIHEAQYVSGLQEYRGRYAGSLLQLDFGEAGQDKFAWIIEARPGRPPETVEAVKIRSGRRLQEQRLSLEQLERRTADLAGFDGWLKLRLQLDEPRPGLRERVMRELPNTLAVVTELSGGEAEPPAAVTDASQLDLNAEYRRYCLAARQQEPSPELAAAFRELYAATYEEGDGQ